MKCRKAQRLLSARFDGEIDEARKRAVEAHLSGCPACQRFAENLARCSYVLNEAKFAGPKPGFTDRLMSRLPQSPAKRMCFRAWFMSMDPAHATAAALALACGVGMAIWINGQQSPVVPNREDPATIVYEESFAALPGESTGARYLALVEEQEK